MKKLIYTLALVVIGITSSNAQEPAKRKFEGRERQERNDKLTIEQRAEKAANAMQKRLNLSDDQKLKVQQIELERARKNDEWRNQDDKAMRTKMEERKAFMISSKEKMDKILTEEQKKTLADSRNDMREKMKDRKGKRPGKPGERTPPPPTPPSNN